ncbi:MAG TPA: lactate dehydrogenase [Sphingobacterium sp.]|nr:lactate dehydrogenase [Sphingobacterium sp.]
MKVVAYNIKEFEKEQLALANAKVHDLTLISNELNFRTLHYSIGKEVVIISERDKVGCALLDALYDVGVKKIITRSVTVDHIDIEYASKIGVHVANIPSEHQSSKNIAARTIMNLNNWGNGDCLGDACQCVTDCPKRARLSQKSS